MARYKKEEVHKVDMSRRWEIKIVHEEFTTADEKEWETELIETDERMRKAMQKYENHLRALIDAALSDTKKDETRDADYFIKQYGERFIGRNPENIKNRVDMYNKYIETNK